MVLVDLDREGRIKDIDAVVASAKLSAIEFANLRPPGVRDWLETLRDALRAPPPWRWLPSAAEALFARALARFRAQSLNVRR